MEGKGKEGGIEYKARKKKGRYKEGEEGWWWVVGGGGEDIKGYN